MSGLAGGNSWYPPGNPSSPMQSGPTRPSLKRFLRRFPRFLQFLRKLRDRLGYAGRALFRTLPAGIDFGPPRGWFFLVDELRAGKVPGRIVSERQPDPQITANSLRTLALL